MRYKLRAYYKFYDDFEVEAKDPAEARVKVFDQKKTMSIKEIMKRQPYMVLDHIMHPSMWEVEEIKD